MSIFSNIINASRSDSYLAESRSGGIAPDNPAGIEAIRSAGILGKQRLIGPEEAGELEATADQVEMITRYTVQAYKAYERIAKADAERDTAYFNAANTDAEAELTRVENRHQHIAKLEGLRPRYAQAGQQVIEAKSKAELQIAHARGRIQGTMKGLPGL